MSNVKHDGLNWHAFARVEKYDPAVVEELTRVLGYEPNSADYKRMSVDPNRVTEADGNLLTTAGLQRVTNLIIGASAAVFGATTTGQAVCGVGSTATAAAVSDTTLLSNTTAENGTVGCRYQATDSIPTAVNGVITAVTTYASGFGNFAWQEWGWVISTGAVTPGTTLASIGATTNQLLNRKVASLGTKASGASWVFTTTVTLS